MRCTKLKAATITTTRIIATTTSRNNNANSGNMKFSMKSDKKSRFLNYNERKADLSSLFLSPPPSAWRVFPQLFLPKRNHRDEWKIFEIRNTKRIIGSRKNEKKTEKEKRIKEKKQNFKWDSDIHLEFWERDRCCTDGDSVCVCECVRGLNNHKSGGH